MFREILIIIAIAASISCFKFSDEKLSVLRTRLVDLQNQIEANKTEIKSESLKEIIADIPLPNTRQGGFTQNVLLCGICSSLASNFMYRRRVLKQSEQELTKLAVDLCVLFRLQSDTVCRGVIQLNTPSIVFIVDSRPDLTSETVCRAVLNVGFCQLPYRDDKLDFTVTIDKGKSVDKLKVDRQNGISESMIIVQLTDIHFDAKYKKGASADCDDYACCHDVKSTSATPNSTAGPWGDYRSCDTPRQAIENAFHQIMKQHSVTNTSDLTAIA